MIYLGHVIEISFFVTPWLFRHKIRLRKMEHLHKEGIICCELYFRWCAFFHRLYLTSIWRWHYLQMGLFFPKAKKSFCSADGKSPQWGCIRCCHIFEHLHPYIFQHVCKTMAYTTWNKNKLRLFDFFNENLTKHQLASPKSMF